MFLQNLSAQCQSNPIEGRVDNMHSQERLHHMGVSVSRKIFCGDSGQLALPINVDCSQSHGGYKCSLTNRVDCSTWSCTCLLHAVQCSAHGGSVSGMIINPLWLPLWPAGCAYKCSSSIRVDCSTCTAVVCCSYEGFLVFLCSHLQWRFFTDDNAS